MQGDRPRTDRAAVGPRFTACACLRPAGELRRRTEIGAARRFVSQIVTRPQVLPQRQRPPLMAPQIGDIVWATATDPATNAPIEPSPATVRMLPGSSPRRTTDALSAGSTVEATWEYNDTSLDAFTTQLTLSESGADQWMSFHIARDPEVPWPVGTYEVKISLNGTPVQQDAVEVREES